MNTLTPMINALNTVKKDKVIVYTKDLTPPALREGQALMNALYEVDIELYRRLVGTDFDCFYDDSKITNFWSAVALEWF